MYKKSDVGKKTKVNINDYFTWITLWLYSFFSKMMTKVRIYFVAISNRFLLSPYRYCIIVHCGEGLAWASGWWVSCFQLVRLVITSVLCMFVITLFTWCLLVWEVKMYWRVLCVHQMHGVIRNFTWRQGHTCECGCCEIVVMILLSEYICPFASWQPFRVMNYLKLWYK